MFHSVHCLATWNNSAPTRWIFVKFRIWIFLEKYVKKIKVSVKSDKITGTLCEDECIFLIISCSFLLIMRNVSEKCRVNQNTYFVFSNFFFENRAAYGVMWKNIVEQGRSQMTMWCMRIACWMTKVTHTQCVILLYHCNCGCKNAPQCYTIHTLPVLLCSVIWWMTGYRLHAEWWTL